MPSRVVIRGRAAYQTRDWRAAHVRPAPRDVDADGVTLPGAPVVGPPRPPSLRAGYPYRDPETDLVFRVVERLDPAEGWGTADFWCRRFRVDFDKLAEWVQLGWVDAAVEAGSPTRRYRPRDEGRLLRDLGVSPRRPRRRGR